MTRNKPGFFIVPKQPLLSIVASVEGTDAAFASAVFVALRWLGNDNGCPDGPVVATVAQIAHRAGMSYNTAAKALGCLKALGLVNVSAQNLAGTQMRGPSSYTFPTIGGALPTAAPPRRAEIIQKERKELKELDPCAVSASPPVASKSSPISQKPITPKPRNELLDALASLDGSAPEQITGSAWSGIGKALSEIKAVCVDVTPDEIRRRADNYAIHFRDAAISPHALAKHWARCDRAPRTGLGKNEILTDEDHKKGF